MGSHLSDRLVSDGHQLVVLDDLSSGHRENLPGSANLYQMDLGSRYLERMVQREKPEAVLHLGAQISVRRSVEDPLFDARVNVLGSLGLIEACRRHDVRRFLFASTGGAIYGETDRIPTPEDYPPSPLSPYGVSKLSLERYLHVFHELDGFSSLSLRLANVYGPRQDPHGEAGVVAILSEALLRRETATINGDGLQTRDYVYVGDVVEAFMLALERDVQGAINIGTTVETNVNDLYALIAKAASSAAEPQHGPAKPGEQRRSCLDIQNAQQSLGWAPQVGLEAGIGKTVDWFRAHRATQA